MVFRSIKSKKGFVRRENLQGCLKKGRQKNLGDMYKKF